MPDPNLLDPRTEADAAIRSMLDQLATRVRRARDDRHMPRRVLSERSGVSMRTLAQLEARGLVASYRPERRDRGGEGAFFVILTTS